MGLFRNKNKNGFDKIRDKDYELTDKGRYFMSYCKKIADGVWKESDYISAYEKQLMETIETIEIFKKDDQDVSISRKTAAKIILLFNKEESL